MNENKKNIKYVKCIIAIICCIIIFSFSAVPATGSTKQSKGLTYTIIKVLNGNKLKNIAYTCMFCIIYAIFDEIHQIYVPGRTGKVIDVIIDTLGACMGITIILIRNKFNYKKKD